MIDTVNVPRGLLRRVLKAMDVDCSDLVRHFLSVELRALLDALAEPAPVQEPIGWYWEYNGRPEGKVFFGKAPDQDVIERGLRAEFPCIVRYVYTAPQAQQQKLDRLEHVHKATADLLLDSDTLLKQALGELERAEQIMLRECGIGVINVNTIAAIKTHLGQA